MTGPRVTDWFEYTATVRPQLPFLRMEGRSLSYAEAERTANRWAHALTGQGAIAGERIACLSTNSIEMGVMLIGAAKAGVAPVMLNYRLAPPEWLAILRDSEPRVLFARGDRFVHALHELLAQHPLPGMGCRIALDCDPPPGWTTLARFLDGQPETRPEPAATGDDLLLLMYTSGTIGLPKGVMITHANVIAHVEQSMTASSASKAPGERALVATPLYHAAGVLRIMNAAIKGGTVVLMEHFDAARFVETLEAERINTCNMVPTILQSLLDEIPDLDRRDFGALRVIYYGAAPITETLLRRALQVFRCDLIQGYGLTESTGGIAYLNEVDHARALAGQAHLLRSTGRAVVMAQIRIVGDDGRELPRGEIGELVVRGPNVMKGYWRDPQATAQAIRDGWLHSGDLASMDAEGYVYLHDRLKDMVVSGGSNVYPREVENALAEHPAIADVAVIGVPDRRWGEALLAVCVTRGPAPAAGELVGFCRTRLGGYKIPRRYVFVDALPRNASGKVLKRVLRTRYAGVPGAADSD